MSWKDEYRERKEASGKTWDEFVKQDLHHQDEIDGLEQEVEQLSEQVEGLTEVVQRLQRELFEANIVDDRKD